MQDTIIKRRKSNSKSNNRKLPDVKPPYEGIFTAEIVVGEGDDPTQAEITDMRLDDEHEMRKWKEAIVCPKCATKIE